MSDQANVTVIQPQENGGFSVGNGSALDSNVAMALLQSNFNVAALRPQTLLKKEEWVHFDKAVTEVATQRLIGVGDLMSRGLSFPLPNALGKTSIEWQKVSDMEGAEVSMAGVTEGQNDRIDFGLDSMPIPIIHKDFTLNIRALAASRNENTNLDTTQVEYATRKVSETLEKILFTGTTILGSSKAIYGYTTAPNRNTVNKTAAWSTATGANIMTDVIKMINAAHGDHMYGPYVIYVPLGVFTHMSEDYKADSDKTILQRVLEVPGISAVRPAENLTGDNIIMAQMTRDVVEMVDGIQPTVVQWATHGGFVQHFKIIAIMVPRFKSDYNGQSGIVHLS